MRKIKVIKHEFVLEGEDINTIKQALTYAKHRLTKHKNTGAHHCLSLNEVARLLREIE